MTHCDPEVDPDLAQRLALGNKERIQLAGTHLRAARIALPGIRRHAVFQASVENQFAEGLAPAIRAMARPANESLPHHEAIHAIVSVCAGHVFEAMKSKDRDDSNTAMAHNSAAVERLTTKSWRQEYGPS